MHEKKVELINKLMNDSQLGLSAVVHCIKMAQGEIQAKDIEEVAETLHCLPYFSSNFQKEHYPKIVILFINE
jgi:hypothetical protein